MKTAPAKEPAPSRAPPGKAEPRPAAGAGPAAPAASLELALGSTLRLCRGGASCGCPSCRGEGGGSGDAAPSSAVESGVKGAGRPLGRRERAFFEPRFGRSLEHVRVHTGSDADASARTVGAQAYALGPHLVFRSGRYRPGTGEGRSLLAHEIAHTFQAPSYAPRRRGDGYPVAPADGADERAADRSARAALSGGAVGGAWRLAATPAPRAPATVRRQEDEGVLGGFLSDARSVEDWASGKVQEGYQGARDVAGRGVEAAREGYHAARSAVGHGVEAAREGYHAARSAVGHGVEAVREGYQEVRSAVGHGVDAVREGFASLVEGVSPFLARMVREGPLTVLSGWVRETVGGWIRGLLGGASPGELVGRLGRWIGAFVAALAQDVEASGGFGCWAFAQVVGVLGNLGRAILHSPVVEVLRTSLVALHTVFSEVVGAWARNQIEQLTAVWTGLQAMGGELRRELQQVRTLSEEAWTWLSGELGLGGEGGILSRLQDLASRAWRSLKEDVAPAALAGLRQVGIILYQVSGLEGAGESIAAARELWTALGWLWEHRGDTDLARLASEDPAVQHTFLPAALRALRSFADQVASHVDWLYQQISPLVEAVTAAVGPLEDLPVIGAVVPVLRLLGKGLQALWGRVAKEMPRISKKVRSWASEAWKVVRSILAVAAVIVLVVMNPPLLPFVVLGLFALGAWILLPACYKAPVIDLVLDLALEALRVAPDLPLFGPLWSLMRPGFIGFLEEARSWSAERKVTLTERVAKLLLWSGPEFALGFVWGFLKGMWEDLIGVFVLVWDILKGLWELTAWLDGEARQLLGLPSRESGSTILAAVGVTSPAAGAATGVAGESAAASSAPSGSSASGGAGASAGATRAGAAAAPPEAGSVGARLRAFVDEVRGPVQTIVSGFMDAMRDQYQGHAGSTFDILRAKLGELWAEAQDSMQAQGKALADQAADAILSPSAAEVGGDMAYNVGESIGWLAGTIVMEVIFFLLSEGIINVAEGAHWAVEAVVGLLKALNKAQDILFSPVFGLLERLGGWVFRIVERLASSEGVVGGALRRIMAALRTVGDALVRLGRDLLEAAAPALERIGLEVTGREVVRGAARAGAHAEERALGAGEGGLEGAAHRGAPVREEPPSRVGEGGAARREEPPAPRAQEQPPSPRVEEQPPAPRAEERPPAPRVEERPPAPNVEERPPAPRVEEEPRAPRVEEEPAPVGREPTSELSDIDRAAEYEWIEANQGQVRPSSDPRYLAEIELPGGEHVWRMDFEGRWCRFSSDWRCFLGEGPHIEQLQEMTPEQVMEWMGERAPGEPVAAPPSRLELPGLSAAENERFAALVQRDPATLTAEELEALQDLRVRSGSVDQGLFPGTAEHKAQRWAEYRERGGQWEYDHWSSVYQSNMLRAQRGHQIADAYHEVHGWGKREVTVEVGGQRRRLDIADVRTRRAVEVKEGYVSRSDEIMWEVRRDAELVQQQWTIMWYIEGRLSDPLRDELRAAGILFREIHPRVPIEQLPRAPLFEFR